jgi:hypothetical protein
MIVKTIETRSRCRDFGGWTHCRQKPQFATRLLRVFCERSHKFGSNLTVIVASEFAQLFTGLATVAAS